MPELAEFIQTASVAEVRETLDFLFHECAIDQAPSSDTVMQWQHILQQRGHQFAKLAQLCHDFLQESHQS